MPLEPGVQSRPFVVNSRSPPCPRPAPEFFSSAGDPQGVEVLLVHPGGPFWARKDDGAWSIPKGLADEGEDLLAAAKREVLEETGLEVEGNVIALGGFRQPGGKIVVAWALEGDFDPANLRSNMFSDRMASSIRESRRIPGS